MSIGECVRAICVVAIKKSESALETSESTDSLSQEAGMRLAQISAHLTFSFDNVTSTTSMIL